MPCKKTPPSLLALMEEGATSQRSWPAVKDTFPSESAERNEAMMTP